MIKRLVETFLHPVGILTYTVALSLIVGSEAFTFVVFGIELVMLRHHHSRFTEHAGSCFDHDLLAIAGVITSLLGLCWLIAKHGPMLAIGAVATTLSMQILSTGWHAWQHETESGVDAAIKVLAGSFVSLALAIGMTMMV